MGFLSDDDANELETEYVIVCSELRNLIYEIVELIPKLKTESAKKYCQFGLARRATHLRKCVERFSSIFISEIAEREISSEDRFEQTAYLNYFFLCISGSIDNLARIIAYENGLVLDDVQISIHNKKIREVMPSILKSKVDEHIEWLNRHIKAFRDPVAHRIPPYVIPEMQFDDGTKTNLSFYVHDFDSSPLVSLHPQVISDVRAFIEICDAGIKGIIQTQPKPKIPQDVKHESLRILVDCNIDEMTEDKVFEHIAHLIDGAYDHLCHFSAIHAQKVIEDTKGRSFSSIQKLEIQYFLANSWNVISQIRGTEEKNAFQWERHEIEREVVILRTLIKNSDFERLPSIRQAQIKTNLANRLSEIGRPISAIRSYNSALGAVRGFGMALGGKGVCLNKFAMQLYDRGHARIISQTSYKLLLRSSKSNATEPHAKKYFDWYIQGFNKKAMRTKKLELDSRELGRSKKEREYRRWCAAEGLFLNPLNDLGMHALAFRDIFGMPSMTVKIDEGNSPPKFYKYFNVLKQEYVSARYLFFEGLRMDRTHFSDRNVLIYDTLDYPAHSLAMEQIKTAYRIAYSLLDKVAFFLRDYYEIKIGDEQVYFKSIWYNGGDRNRGLRKIFSDSQNLPLRGLFWLSKDLFEKSGEFKNSIDPQAEYLYELRNSMEHRFFSLHQMVSDRNEDSRKRLKLAEDELEQKTLEIFKIVREALIYLSLSVNREEVRRSDKNKEGVRIPMDIPIYEDSWKKRW